MEIRTDLAVEWAEMYWETAEEKQIPGVNWDEKQEGEIRITRVEILDQTGEEALGKQKGRYVTIEMPSLLEMDGAVQEAASRQLAAVIQEMAGKRGLTLVAGLGNSRITPDSLGPKVIPRLVVTRHLFSHLPSAVAELAPVCALAPGVLGVTGMETGEIIKGVADRVKPDLVIVVDALASRKTERVSTTIQVADTGISPGSGVGNRRKAVNEETIGVPVIAIGVPMVVDAATIANDTIDLVMEQLAKEENGKIFSMLQSLKTEEKEAMIRGALPNEMGGMMVTPKDIDTLAEKVASIVADGINFALHPGITRDEIMTFVG